MFDQLLKFLLISTILLSSLSRADDRDLAQKYSLTIYQGTGVTPEADVFTRVDFDGDWNPLNNWDHLKKFPLPPTVYYDVIKTEQYTFITFGFFYPRDYAPVCFWVHCHENDFEGARITVNESGKVTKLEGLAHNDQSQILNPQHLEITIEKEGHGIHPRLLRAPDKQFKKYLPSDYELRPLKELMDRKDTALFKGSFEIDGKSYPEKFDCSRWCLWNIGGARPAWAWEIRGKGLKVGEWYFHPVP